MADDTRAHGYAVKGKFSKAQVKYERPSQGLHHCSECRHFEVIEKRHCEIVQGIILPADWCNKWTAKA